MVVSQVETHTKVGKYRRLYDWRIVPSEWGTTTIVTARLAEKTCSNHRYNARIMAIKIATTLLLLHSLF